MLKYYNFQLALQEIPDEITLAINITGCPNHCDGCHSPWLQEDTGTPFNEEVIDTILKNHDGFTCICFMGGDADHEAINRLAKYVKDKYSIKVAWYSGQNELPKEIDLANFDYWKYGHFDKLKGGLDSIYTNQHLLKIKDNGKVLEDITHEFWDKKV